MIERLYDSPVGARLLKLAAKPRVTQRAAALFESKLSSVFIKPYIRRNGIDTSECVSARWRSFNDFFTRELKSGARPIDERPGVVISPSDGYASVFPISEDGILMIKGRPCTIAALLEDRELARDYCDGTCVVVRLTPSDYHRYCYPTDGRECGSLYLQGTFHSVRQSALNRYPVYGINSREITKLETGDFGEIIFVEVGAMMIGRIHNYHKSGDFNKGEEKGYFEFGGSTILMLFKKGAVRVDEKLLSAARSGGEYKVRQGVAIAVNEKVLK